MNDHSIGPLYLAQTKMLNRHIKWSKGEITEECQPWRRGKTLIIPLGVARRAVLVGWWRKTQRTFESEQERELFEDVQWLDPQRLFNQPEEIADWDDGRTEEEKEELKQRTAAAIARRENEAAEAE